MNKPELLAPAGDTLALKAAVRAGADAIYIGGAKFGARAYAEGLGAGNLDAALDYCHLHGRKVYLTVNTLLKEKELNNELVDFLRPAYEAGLDAVIVQDFGVLRTIRENFPNLPIHASTQMCVSSSYGMKLLGQMGASRVIFPRELSLCELRKAVRIAGINSGGKRGNERSSNSKNTNNDGLETEVFVHGALCYCVSGQCLMSSIIGGRSGNRGRCAQVCRLPFPDEHLLNLKDLNTLGILPDIIESGVTSLKIEGRMKSPLYTAGTVSIYRKYIDKYLELRNGTTNLESTLSKVAKSQTGERGLSAEAAKEAYKVASSDVHALIELFNRGGYTTGYFETHNSKKMIFKGEKPEMRTPDEKVVKDITEKYLDSEIKAAVKAKVTIIAGRPAKMELELANRPAKMELEFDDDAGTNAHDGLVDNSSNSRKNYKVVVKGDIAQPAQSRPLTEEDIEKRISKFGDTDFELEGLEINLRGRVFMPVSAINKLRRDAIEKLQDALLASYRRGAINSNSNTDKSNNNPANNSQVATSIRGGER